MKPWAIIESEIWNHVIVDARGSATRLDARSARIWSKDNSHDKDQGLVIFLVSFKTKHDEIWDFSRTNTWEVLVPMFWFAFWIFQFSVCFEAVAPSDHAVEIHSGGGHSFTRRLMQRRRLRKSHSTKYHKNQKEAMSCRTYICMYIYTHRALKSCGGRVWRSLNVWGDAGCTTVCDPEDGRYHYCGYTHSECACQHCVPRKKLAVAFHRIQVHDMTPEWKFDSWSRIQGSSLRSSFEDMEDDDEFVVFK